MRTKYAFLFMHTVNTTSHVQACIIIRMTSGVVGDMPNILITTLSLTPTPLLGTCPVGTSPPFCGFFMKWTLAYLSGAQSELSSRWTGLRSVQRGAQPHPLPENCSKAHTEWTHLGVICMLSPNKRDSSRPIIRQLGPRASFLSLWRPSSAWAHHCCAHTQGAEASLSWITAL